jgi:hypothetical protein
MAAEVFAAIGAFKSLFDIARALKDVPKDPAQRDRIVVDLLAKMGEAQTAHLALIQRVHDLEKELQKRRDWDRQKKRYELKEIGIGVFAYVRKPAVKPIEPTHCLCPACYDQERKSILQASHHLNASELFCPTCKTEIAVQPQRPEYPLRKP